MEKTVSFWDIFRRNPDGTIEPTRIIKMGGIKMGPGVRLGSGVKFGGVDLTQYTDENLKIQENSDSSSILEIIQK